MSANTNEIKIILASASPRRRELLATAGFEFEIKVSQADESVPEGTAPACAAAMVARKKALAVSADNPDACVLGADTIVVLGGEIMGKPADRADAVRMLTGLSGKTHTVITGVCLAYKGESVSFAQETRVKFYSLSPAEIEAYVESSEPMDKAGAYGIQGRGCTLVEGIEGDYFNVVGLPVARVSREIRKLLNGN